ncbi:M1 family metallopeptidase [Streptomyces sp. NPDC059740]|uniref:M1 family metallopeptidase n=1 Tax=Streptomyces sp. NPDC059740 TaxID=3346926 RepID=UPI003652F08C
MDRSRLRVSCAALSLLLPLTSSVVGDVAAGGAPRGAAGAGGLGDPLFPKLGNGGYDVRHYGLDLGYDVRSGRLTGTARITATAREDLASYSLDLRGLSVRRVEVDGRQARFSRSRDKLRVVPERGPHRGARFVTTVRYDGVPHAMTDADGSTEGWARTGDGAFVAGQPAGSMTWFPSNNHPSDKASFDISVTVPAGYTGIANGELRGRRTAHGRTTFRWQHSDPMATYLATATVGRFRVSRSRVHGIPLYVAVDPSQSALAAGPLARLGDVLEWERGLFGRYPFASSGAVVDRAPPGFGYALEVQTKPLYSQAPDVPTVVHEMAHQWFGDSVTPRTWQDIWLNEGFATYAEWLWDAHTGGPSTRETAERLLHSDAASPLWSVPPGRPGTAVEVLGDSVYKRGALVLQKLREAVGDRAFFRILREWPAAHRHGNAGTRQFEDFCRRRTDRDLDAVFGTWLYGRGKPGAH